MRNALGQDVDVPESILIWTGEIGDGDRLIEQLTDSATQIRRVDARHVTTDLFNHFHTPTELADLLDGLAAKLRIATTSFVEGRFRLAQPACRPGLFK